MQYSDLLFWWIVSISWSAVFLIAVSFYLYLKRRNGSVGAAETISRQGRLSDFVFVLVLAGLLGLYIVSIDRTSSIIFAAGNIVVEAILIAYTIRNRTVRS